MHNSLIDFIYFPTRAVFSPRIRNKINLFPKHCSTSTENNIVMFSCLFSGVELVVRDAQGGVSVYNVETNKHRVLLTSSSFVSANLPVYQLSIRFSLIEVRFAKQ